MGKIKSILIKAEELGIDTEGKDLAEILMEVGDAN